MKWRKLIRGNLFGLTNTDRDDWKLNRFTLAFTGPTKEYEKGFREDYFDRSLNPMRFSLVLAILFFDIFAFLDVLLLPELRNLFWFIRFGVITPLLASVIFFSFSPHFRKYMQPMLSLLMYLTGLSIIVMLTYASGFCYSRDFRCK